MNRMYQILNTMTALFRWIGKLYPSLRTQVHLLFMPMALVCKQVKDPLELDILPDRIAFAQKRVVHRRSHNCKGALFPKYPDNLRGLSGKGSAAYRDAKSASEVC
ncbi:MAG: hypothetical protein LBF27_12165 [Sphingobacterium sp.]|nr:hypothetical protein [Sphingobacterium sp.]